MRAVVVGAGLGGLLSAARLSQEGYQVDVYERLPIPGGRFTNIEYKEHQLSTGALHMIPHGPSGPLARLLGDVGVRVEIVRSNPLGVIRIPEGDIMFEDFPRRLSILDQLRLLGLNVSSRFVRPGGSFYEWFSRIDDPYLERIGDSFCGWSLSLTSRETPAREALEIIRNIRRYGGPGIPVGGCRAIIDALLSVIKANDGRVHLESPVDMINGEGVRVNGEWHRADLVISNLGHRATARLMGDPEYEQRVQGVHPSQGVKICLSAPRPLLGHTGVLFTPYARRVNGLNEVTNADPTLAPRGRSLVMSHQALRSGDVEREIELGLRDLKELFPDVDYEVLMVQTYRDGWPVNRAASGMDMGQETPLSNVWVVGDGAKGHGGIEVEGIAMGVKQVMNRVL